MALTDAFVWGSGGSRKTPEQIARDREIATALMAQGMDFSPVGHWTQGLARVANAAVGAFKDYRAGQADTQNAAESSKRIAALLGGIGGQDASSAFLAAPAATPAAQMDYASSRVAQAHNPQGSEIAAGLVQRGLPQHVADAFVMNMKDESNLNPGINEANPIVPGSRGGYGLYQLTGPRRRAYEVYAAAQGASPDNVDAQLDFLMSELQGPERSAYDAIMAAPDTGSAAAVIVNKFLRPAEQHRASREARYLRSAGVPFKSGNYDPAADARANEFKANMVGGPNELRPAVQGGGVASALMPEMAGNAPASVRIAQAGSINPAILESLSSPYATSQERNIAGILLQQQMQQSDPMRAMEMEKARLELDALRNPQPKLQPLMNAGDGQIFNPNNGEWITAPGGNAKAPQVVELFDEATGQPYKATWNAQTGAYERVGGVKARSGMQLTTNPDGTVTMTEGPIGNLPKLTESEGRNSGFYGRGVESHKILNDLEAEGTSVWNKTVGNIPVIGNFARSEDAQKYDQSKRDFINAVLRRESGAVISPEEFANAEQQYFPQPGDGPQVIAQKRKNRETTILGLKISSGQGAQFAVPSEQPAGKSKRLKFNPATGELE